MDGPTRNVRFPRATATGGGVVARTEDGVRCAVAGRETLRILGVSAPAQAHHGPAHKSSVGHGGYRIDASRNFWDGSGLKIDSASTDIAWAFGSFSNKILTSARNGELIMWDINKAGGTKYERRTKDHLRAINKMSVSHIVPHYCVTGSADGDMRVWDLRDLAKSIMRVHHAASIRSLVFSPSPWQPLHAAVGLDNGSIYRWDLKMGQRGQLDRLPVAHSAPVTSLDWCNASGARDALPSSHPTLVDGVASGMGWLVSGGLDRRVKVWDLVASGSNGHIPQRPTYVLHPSFPVRRVLWRPGYECELAVVSNEELTGPDVVHEMYDIPRLGLQSRAGSMKDLDEMVKRANSSAIAAQQHASLRRPSISAENMVPLDVVEIWDVRRGWIAKWSIPGTSLDGGVTDITFCDAHAIWAQHASGLFSQIDLRGATKPLDAVPRASTAWDVSGSLAFVADRPTPFEIPYDDITSHQRAFLDPRLSQPKALGDASIYPDSQFVGTFTSTDSADESTAFSQLSRGYIVDGPDRRTLCMHNADVASKSGYDRVAETWLLLAVSLTDYSKFLSSSPKSPAFDELDSSSPNLSRHPATLLPVPTSSSGPSDTILSYAHCSPSSSRKLTPASSASVSPSHGYKSLPPITPHRSSLFSRHNHPDATSSSRHPSARRPSVSITTHNISPNERNTPTPSLRHVGEGVLDDSDSDSDGHGIGAHATHGLHDNGGPSSACLNSISKPLLSPKLHVQRAVAPSPLSRVAVQRHGTEEVCTSDDIDTDIADVPEYDDDDDDDDDSASSPSPGSTDSEPEGSLSPRRSKGPRLRSMRSSVYSKTPRRGSTVASLAASPASQPQFARRESRSSVRTVTAGPTPPSHDLDVTDGRRAEEQSQFADESWSASRRAKTLSLLGMDSGMRPDDDDDPANPMTERILPIVRDDDQRIRDISWNALREIFEQFSQEGDVQTCAMLSIMAPEELQLSRRRVSRFLDAYIDLLNRFRLYSCAAHLRKYCKDDDLQKATLLDTTIYTTCGSCQKPLTNIAVGKYTTQNKGRGGYTFCYRCLASSATCAICRLPVKSLLFQCSVCNHGGHQACYRFYYMQQPMIKLPATPSELPLPVDPRGRTAVGRSINAQKEEDVASVISSQSNATEFIPEEGEHKRHESGLWGRPCAAGCGHFCWAANGASSE